MGTGMKDPENLLDFVRQEMGDETLSDEACEFILWEKTAFPAGGVEVVRRQINEFRDYIRRKEPER